MTLKPKIVLIIIVVVLLFGGVIYTIFGRTADSPLAHENKMQGLQEKWGGKMLLPTYMPKYYFIQDANVDNKYGHQLIINTDLLSIVEEPTTKHSIDHLAFGQMTGETIDQVVQRVQKLKGPYVGGGTNTIEDIEGVTLGDGKGYWYKLSVGFDAGSVQRVDFIQDGLLIQLSAPLSVTKDEFLKVARSFAFVNMK